MADNRGVNRRYTPRRLAFVADHGVLVDEDQSWSYLGNGYTVFNQEGKPLSMGRIFRTFEIDERPMAQQPLRPFTDLLQDDSYESQRERVRRQAALYEEYDRHQVDARHRRHDTVHNAVLLGDMEVGRVVPPSNSGLLRPPRRASTGREVVVSQPLPHRQQQGQHDAELSTHGDGDQPSEVTTDQQHLNPRHSRINYDEWLHRHERH